MKGKDVQLPCFSVVGVFFFVAFATGVVLETAASSIFSRSSKFFMTGAAGAATFGCRVGEGGWRFGDIGVIGCGAMGDGSWADADEAGVKTGRC